MIVALGGTYALIIRPYHMRWGATDQKLALPGDAANPAGAPISTRAITIRAPAATVWAWRVGGSAACWPRRRKALGETTRNHRLDILGDHVNPQADARGNGCLGATN